MVTSKIVDVLEIQYNYLIKKNILYYRRNRLPHNLFPVQMVILITTWNAMAIDFNIASVTYHQCPFG